MKKSVAVLLGGVSLCIALMPSRRASGQSLQAPPEHSSGPVTDYAAARPDAKDVLRFRRGERYNIPDPNLAELTEDSPPAILDLPLSHSRRDPMPLATSDTVVIATIKTGQAYLSNDKRDIYSEFAATVDEVVKTPTAPYLRAGNTIDVQRHGGMIKLPSGKTLVRGAMSDSMPVVGGQYLLFLKYNPDTEDYHLETGHRLQNGRAYQLDSDGQTKDQALRVEGSADELISRVRNLAKRKEGSQ
jgi:hypothetical protein